MSLGVIHFQPSRKSDGAPEVRQMPIEPDEDFTLGAPLTRDGSNPENVLEHPGATTVDGLIGFAMTGAKDGLPEGKGGMPYRTEIPVAIANKDVEYLGMLRAGASGDLVVPDAATHEGVAYGIIKQTGTGNWYVDTTDTTNVVLRVTRVLPEIRAVLFKIIASAIGD